MVLKRTVYADASGNEWEIEKNALPKLRGMYVYWIAECKKLSKSFRSDKKKDLIFQIKINNINNKQTNSYGTQFES
jgi:hypothetical protein